MASWVERSLSLPVEGALHHARSLKRWKLKKKSCSDVKNVLLPHCVDIKKGSCDPKQHE